MPDSADRFIFAEVFNLKEQYESGNKRIKSRYKNP